MSRDIILIADDMKINRKILRNIFEEQYQILEAEDGQAAIDLLDEQGEQIALLLLDLAMPKKTGLEVLDFMKENQLMSVIPVIMITGEATADTDKEAYDAGVSDIVYKPFEATIVMRRAQNLIELFSHKNNLEVKLEERTQELRRKSKELEESHEKLLQTNDSLIKALGSIVEYKTMRSGEHIERVKRFTSILLEHLMALYPELGITEDDKLNMVSAAALHDIGKIAVPESILLAPRELSSIEQEVVNRHAELGVEILQNFNLVDSKFYRYALDICKYHHERYDGTGFPEKLVGNEIPLCAQVVGLADTFDNLVTKRAYRAEYAVETAARMIEEGKCGGFSPELLQAFGAAKLELYKLAEEQSYVAG